MKPYDVQNERRAEHLIDKIFLERWSPRAISSIGFTDKDLMILFEAARWSPSNGNNQPWRFLYALNGSEEWKTFFDLLLDFNKMWCEKAGALIVVLSKKAFDDGTPDRTHSFCAGSAWMSFALQARMIDLVAHGMAGFDYDKTRAALKVPEGFDIEAMIAVGKQGEIEELHERIQKSEKPNSRKTFKEITASGEFPESWK